MQEYRRWEDNIKMVLMRKRISQVGTANSRVEHVRAWASRLRQLPLNESFITEGVDVRMLVGVGGRGMMTSLISGCDDWLARSPFGTGAQNSICDFATQLRTRYKECPSCLSQTIMHVGFLINEMFYEI